MRVIVDGEVHIDYLPGSARAAAEGPGREAYRVVFEAMVLRARNARIMHCTLTIFFTCVSYKRDRYSSL